MLHSSCSITLRDYEVRRPLDGVIPLLASLCPSSPAAILTWWFLHPLQINDGMSLEMQ